MWQGLWKCFVYTGMLLLSVSLASKPSRRHFNSFYSMNANMCIIETLTCSFLKIPLLFLLSLFWNNSEISSCRHGKVVLSVAIELECYLCICVYSYSSKSFH